MADDDPLRRGKRTSPAPVTKPEPPASPRVDAPPALETLIYLRAAAAPIAVLQVFAYVGEYPPGIKVLALALCGLILLANLWLWLTWRGARTKSDLRAVGVGSLLLDLIFVAAFTWLYSFDTTSAIWVTLYLIPIEGALLFALPGALWAWIMVTAVYIGREFHSDARYDIDLEWSRIFFRMSLALLIALATGFMSRDLNKERRRLETALEEMTRIDRLRSTLVSTLAHDLRNPLTAIRGAHRTLMTRDVESEQASQLIGIADRHSARLQRLAIDLLELARLEGGRLELNLRGINLHDAVSGALSYVEGGSRFELNIPDELEARADPERLQQMLVNLADNAMRYGQEPFEVTGSRNGATVSITVSDQGEGLPEDLRSSVFEAFGGHHEGMSVGFGLAIVRGLAEAHGGKARYEPNSPKGSCFILELPAA